MCVLVLMNLLKSQSNVGKLPIDDVVIVLFITVMLNFHILEKVIHHK